MKRPPTLSERILAVLGASVLPVTTPELTRLANSDLDSVWYTLRKLARDKLVVKVVNDDEHVRSWALKR